MGQCPAEPKQCGTFGNFMCQMAQKCSLCRTLLRLLKIIFSINCKQFIFNQKHSFSYVYQKIKSASKNICTKFSNCTFFFVYIYVSQVTFCDICVPNVVFLLALYKNLGWSIVFIAGSQVIIMPCHDNGRGIKCYPCPSVRTYVLTVMYGVITYN